MNKRDNWQHQYNELLYGGFYLLLPTSIFSLFYSTTKAGTLYSDVFLFIHYVSTNLECIKFYNFLCFSTESLELNKILIFSIEKIYHSITRSRNLVIALILIWISSSISLIVLLRAKNIDTPNLAFKFYQFIALNRQLKLHIISFPR